MIQSTLSAEHLRRASQLMIQAAHQAGAIQEKYFRQIRSDRSIGLKEKLNEGLVTQADLASEKIIMKTLKGFSKSLDFLEKDFTFLAEESHYKSQQKPMSKNHSRLSQAILSEGRWIIDPLDGTTNFVHQFPMFCVSIALEFRGEILIGVIYHPVLKDTYLGIKNKGATVNGRRLQVSKTKKLSNSLLSTGFTYRKTELLHQEMEAFERLSGIARAIRRPGSAALDLAYTARGVFDGFWERRLSPWDVAAGALLVQEAGGCVSNFTSLHQPISQPTHQSTQKPSRRVSSQQAPYRVTPFSIQEPSIIASNLFLQKELRKIIIPEFCAI
jgi:myo-inositol-1(or 4)-monophosphatase